MTTPGADATSAAAALRAAHEAWIAAQRDAEMRIREANAPDTSIDRAEGYRYLSRLCTTALWTFVENADPLFPTLYRNADAHKKFGVDNPDNVYLRCALDGSQTYRLWGQRGEAPYVGITVGAEFYGARRAGGRQGTLSQHHLDEFAISGDGGFELTLSPVEQPGNWIPLTPEATGMIVRQTFFEPGTQRRADLHIERVGASGPPPALDPARMAAQLERAATFVTGCTRMFLRMADGWAQRENQLTGTSGESTRHLHGDPDLFYISGYWRLLPDQALVIDVEPAERFLYWGFQLCNYWLESLDYVHHNISINSGQARAGQDGRVRLVVAHRDPGVPNWIDTAGHTEGAMCFRWLLAENDPPIPRVCVVPAAELSG